MDSDNGWVKGGWFSQGHPQNPTNVTRISRAINAEDDAHHPQVVYYQAGIGTGIGLSNQVLGGGTGLGLSENIREAYAFLASNYRENDPERPGVDPDSIFLIGFSRGAYTARSIAGLLGAVGLLKKRAMPHFYEVFSDFQNAGDKHYKPLFFDQYMKHHRDVPNVKPPNSLAHDKTQIDHYLNEYLKALLSLNLTQEVQIKCIGVWDTVGALGIPINPILQHVFPFLPSFVREYTWFDTGLDRHTENAFQALALDEHRAPFSPTLWEKRRDCQTNLKQVWFPGAHSNVGGSYDDAGMADITLAWMMDQLAGNTTDHPDGFRPRDWIKFDVDYIKYWQGCELDWYEKHKFIDYKGWAMGHVYDSNTFPESLTGTRIRSPGRYHRTFYETGKSDMKHLLKDTNERIHASVRARIDLEGRSVEPDWNSVFPKGWNFRPLVGLFWRWLTGRGHESYKPQLKGGPLHGWKLDDGHRDHEHANMDIDMTPDGGKDVTWIYEGDQPCQNRVLPEDKLGPFELELLQKDQEFAEQIMLSNHTWKWFKRIPRHAKRSPRVGHTW